MTFVLFSLLSQQWTWHDLKPTELLTILPTLTSSRLLPALPRVLTKLSRTRIFTSAYLLPRYNIFLCFILGK